MLNVFIEIVVGLATAFIGWLGLRLLFQLRFTIEGSGAASHEGYLVRVGNRRCRSLTDVNVSCSLRITHGQKQENDLTLETPAGIFPLVPVAGSER